jgi:hypothetical protein
MSRVKNPVEKKRLSLAKDHRVFVLEGNKTFRKAWRLKKARATRQLRRAHAKELQQADRLVGEAENACGKPRRSLKKLGVMSLYQAIAFKAGDLGERWHLATLAKGKNALAASSKFGAPTRRDKR